MRKGLAYSIPLADFMAQLVLPYDLTPTEAAKLAAVIATLPLPGDTGPLPASVEWAAAEEKG